MNNLFQKINRVNELAESGAHPEVVEGFVIDLEDKFLKAATARVQEGNYELAMREYFCALLLPGRTAAREDILTRAVRALLQADSNGVGLENAQALAAPEFAHLKAELLRRRDEERRKNLDGKFAELDGCASLRAKDFVALEKLLEQMGDLASTPFLVARLRLTREKRAQSFFKSIIAWFSKLADEENLEDFRERLDEEVPEMRKRAVVLSTGIHPLYGEQIREYITRAEDLFSRSHTEGVIDEIHRAGSKVLQDTFVEFKDSIKPELDPAETLKAIVRALKIFRDERLYEEVQRVGAEWAKGEGKLRYRLLAVDQTGEALSLVTRSLEIIHEHEGILPSEISDDLKGFLASLRDELTPRVTPYVPQPVTPATPAHADENRGCLTSLWGGIKKLFTRILPIALLVCTLLLSSGDSVQAQSDVVLAIDLSGTMEQNDPAHLRYYGADQFLTLLSIYSNNRNRGGVVTFGDDARELLALGYVSGDKAGKYKNLFDRLAIEEWTELGRGLALGGRMLGDEHSHSKSIIVISDFKIEGNPAARRMGQEPARMAAERELWDTIVPELKRKGVRVYTIGLFSADAAGRPLMQRLARETGGFSQQVRDPKEFYTIYKRMLDDIEPPSGVATIKGENNRFALTPADYGVIITGYGDFSARAPNGTAYPNKDIAGTAVKQQFVRYPDGTAILFLGQPPDGQQQASNEWTGEWVVAMQGEGQATYLSNVRFSCDERLPPRRAYFKNEYVQTVCKLNVRADLDPRTKAFLEKCETTSTTVRTDQNSAWSRSGKLESKTFEYSGWTLVDQPGEYQQEIQMACGPNAYRTERKRFSVYNSELLTLTILHGSEWKPLQDRTLAEGESIRIAGDIDVSGAPASDLGYKGVRQQKLTFELKYPSATPQKFEVTASQDSKLISDERELEETGSLSIEGELNGELIVSRTDGGEGMLYYPLRARTSKVVQIKRTWKAILESIAWWVGSIILPIAGLFTLFRGKQSHDIGSMSLEGKGGISSSFSEVDLSPLQWLKRAFVLRGGPHVSIGGPGSDADVILPRGVGSVIVEIGKDLFNNFYVVQRGDTQIYLRSPSNALKRNIRERIEPNDKLIIEGNEITFKPTFDDAGD